MMDRPEEQRQRAVAGGVGHENADASPVKAGGIELFVDEGHDLVIAESVAGTTK
jgi:hypothetical protein